MMVQEFVGKATSTGSRCSTFTIPTNAFSCKFQEKESTPKRLQAPLLPYFFNQDLCFNGHGRPEEIQGCF